MTSDQYAIFDRIKAKLEVMRMDFKAQNNNRHRDIDEVLALLELIKRL